MSNARLFAVAALCASVAACADMQVESVPRTGSVMRAYGEPAGDFPTWYERMIHVLTNHARCDPAADLAGCSNCPEAACYVPVAPLQWDYDHNRSARFHATNLTDSSCGMQHDSPCTLVSNLGSIYPSPCDGSMSCACQGGQNCSGGSTTWERLARFGISSGFRAENIAWFGDPMSVFYAWLWEASSDTNCGSNMQNGHRYNILNGIYSAIGVGGDGGYTVQDFSSIVALTQKIPSGAHYPETGTSVDFYANYFDSGGGPKKR